MPKVLTNVREGILLVGRELLAESGYDNLSMRQIAQRCGISVGTLYNHFPSKKMLVSDILRAQWDAHFRRMQQSAKAAGELVDRLMDVYSELRRFLRDIHNAWVVGSLGTMDCVDFHNVQGQRAFVRQCVRELMEGMLPTGDRWLADGISRLFFAYAGEEVDDADALLPDVLRRMIG